MLIIIVFLCLVSALLGLLLFVDGVYIGFFAPEAVVEEYHFGAEAMIAHGGWGYKSKMAYFFSSALKCFVVVTPPFLAVYWFLRRR